MLPSSGISSDRKKESDLSLFTWYPFKESGQCGKFLEFTYLDSWVTNNSGNFLIGNDIFPNKIPVNFGGCNISVYKVKIFSNGVPKIITPFEESIMNLFFKALNVTPVVLENLVLTLPCDVTYGSLSLDYLINDLRQLSITAYPRTSIEMKWFVPCAKSMQRHGNFLKVFSWSVWLFLFFVISLSVLAAYFICKTVVNLGESYLFSNPTSCFICFWSTLMGVSISDMPRTTRLRTYFILWLWYCFAMSTIFQAFFTSFLVEPGFEKQISTVEDLNSSNFVVFRPEIQGIKWCEKTPENNNFCRKSRIKNESNLRCLKRILKGEKVSFFLHSDEMDMYNILGFVKDGEMCSIVDNTYLVHYVSYFDQFSIFREIFNNIIHRFVQSGISEKMKEIHFEDIKNNQDSMFRKYYFSENIDMRLYTQNTSLSAYGKENESFFVYTVSHLRSVFIILLSGYVISLVAFLSERFWNKPK